MEKKSCKSSDKIRVAVVGFGNIGKGVIKSISLNSKMYGDVSLAGIITRRPEIVQEQVPGIKVAGFYEDPEHGLKVSLDADVAILCGGSATDLPEQGPLFASRYSTIDSFDNHSQIPKYFAAMDNAAKESGKVAVISTGWDPGTFSLERMLADAFLPGSSPSAIYGLSERGGLSMGHSEAIRGIEGVEDARQYTHAIPEGIEMAKRGVKLSPGEKHWRECFVVAEDGADKKKIEKDIMIMPGYFEGYSTTVSFITQKEMDAKHSGRFHDGKVIATALMGKGNRGIIEYKNVWDSNPEATANILVAHARAAYRLEKDGKAGAFTILDIPPAYLSPHSREKLLKDFM